MGATRMRANASRILSDGTFITSGTEYYHISENGAEFDITLEEYDRRNPRRGTAVRRSVPHRRG